MHPQKRNFLVINVLGGLAVLGSYAHGLLTQPEAGEAMWGGVPLSTRPLYTVSMLLAAAGYFAYAYYLLFRLDPESVRLGRRFGFGLFNGLILSILAFSAAWMPLTLAMIARPSWLLWLAIRLTLVVVGLASVGLFAALLALRPSKPTAAYWLAIAGSLTFSFQTAVLDAVVWIAYFPV
jgi:hypothetical protein